MLPASDYVCEKDIRLERERERGRVRERERGRERERKRWMNFLGVTTKT